MLLVILVDNRLICGSAEDVMKVKKQSSVLARGTGGGWSGFGHDTTTQQRSEDAADEPTKSGFSVAGAHGDDQA